MPVRTEAGDRAAAREAAAAEAAKQENKLARNKYDYWLSLLPQEDVQALRADTQYTLEQKCRFIEVMLTKEVSFKVAERYITDKDAREDALERAYRR